MVEALDIPFEYIHEDINLRNLIDKIRGEISSAINSARLNNAFDKDVNLSFGKIHINPYGSASTISYKGRDVVDIDKFVITSALKISDNNYFDIREYITTNINEFSFYPIETGKRVELTVYKYSKYFINRYGQQLFDHEKIRVIYAYKYIVFFININGVYRIDAYNSGRFNPYNTSMMQIKYAFNSGGSNDCLYYCFLKNTNYLRQIGETKQDFIDILRKVNPDNIYDFFKGELRRAAIKISIVRDENSKIKVQESIRKSINLLVDIYPNGKVQFCKDNDINVNSLNRFLSGDSSSLMRKNGDVINKGRLLELLGVNFDLNAITLLNKNLLEQVSFNDIPDGEFRC